MAILDLMAKLETENVERELHENIYGAIASFQKDDNLQVAYLANHCTQDFTKIHDNQTGWDDATRRAYHILQGLSKINLSLTEPLALLSSIDAYPLLKEAFQFQDGEKQWFADLIRLRCMIFRRNKRLRKHKNQKHNY